MTSKYNLVARIYPAILCSIPIIVLNFFFLSDHISDFITAIEGVKWFGGVTISVVFAFLLAQVGRHIGKDLFEKIHFNDELHMPTTRMLMHTDPHYSNDHTTKIHDKIFSDFGIKVCTLSEEQENPNKARKLIVECVSLIRGKVKDGRLLLQHNIEYGFVRNLIGGSVISVFISILNMIIFGIVIPNALAYKISIALAVAYLLIVICGRSIINRYGIRYAKILIQEYLSI